jgi:hypothetical protein
MDSLITYKEAAEFKKNPPTMLPWPDFAKLRALWKHMMQALKQLVCPQSQIHGLTGIVMGPGLYALIKPVAFTVPVNPGATPAYQNFAPPVLMKMVDYAFERNKITSCPTATLTEHASACWMTPSPLNLRS